VLCMSFLCVRPHISADVSLGQQHRTNCSTQQQLGLAAPVTCGAPALLNTLSCSQNFSAFIDVCRSGGCGR
jgi:hypothetical protein